MMLENNVNQEVSNNEIAELKKQVQQHSQAAQALMAQLDAHKATLSESMAGLLTMRTNVNLLQKANEDLKRESDAKINDLNKQVASLNQQLFDATASIAKLEESKSPETQAA